MKQNKRTAGFTLVELIVVIAIMGILAGVGTVGYAGYVKSAAKKADLTLVGNVMRAAETGSYSTMYNLDNPLTISNTTFPIGFVVLNHEADGSGYTAKTISSGSTITNNSEKECVVKKVSCCVFTDYSDLLKRYTKKSSSFELTYCETHSTNTAYLPVYKSGYEYGGFSKYTYSGYLYEGTNNSGYLATFADGSDKCNVALTQTDDTFATGSSAATNSGELHNAVAAAFGNNYPTALKLQYDGWTTTDEGQVFSSLYSDANSVMKTVKDLSADLVSTCDTIADYDWAIKMGNRLGLFSFSSSEEVIKKILSQSYDSSAEVVTNVAGAMKTIGYDTFKQEWEKVDNSSETSSQWSQAGFGLNSYGREYYCAARQGYNSAFASWLTAKGYSSYASAINSFQRDLSEDSSYSEMLNVFSYIAEKSGKTISTSMPAVVCKSAFVDTESPLYQTLGATDSATCLDLYKEYVESGASAANCKTFYDTMVTINDTADKAGATGSDEDFFNYYTPYLTEIQQLYSAAQAEASKGKSSIIIMVTMQNGEVNCTVSPSTANPRNS